MRAALLAFVLATACSSSGSTQGTPPASHPERFVKATLGWQRGYLQFDSFEIRPDCSVTDSSSGTSSTITLRDDRCLALKNVLTRDDVVAALHASSTPTCGDLQESDVALVVQELTLDTGLVTHGIDVTRCAYGGVEPYSDLLHAIEQSL